ncbi:hypothetical protein [Massilicoli timonensis]|uniref:hypothetical protein n=1 Tax=Massilicoli timonensis TaxID=2015901 RepID=UPI001CA5359B|nr:hypothetical protein [Massilicoli timonensis]
MEQLALFGAFYFERRTIMKCKHQFQGHADGVTCLLCGFHLTQDEYVKIMKSKNKEKQDKSRKEGSK